MGIYFKVTLNLNHGIVRDYTVYAGSELNAILLAVEKSKEEGYVDAVLVKWEKVK